MNVIPGKGQAWQYLKRYLLCLLLLNIPVFGAQAQKQGLSRQDSLMAELPTHRSGDSREVMLLLGIAMEMKNSDPDSAGLYVRDALRLAQKIGTDTLMAKAHNAFGNVYKARSDYSNALAAYQQALKMYEDAGDRRNAAVVLMNIGTVYRPLGNFEKALDYYNKALLAATETNNRQTVAQVTGNIGVVHFTKQDYRQSAVFSQKAFLLFKDLNDSSNMAWALGNTGDANAELGNFPLAIQKQEAAITIYRSLGNLAFTASGYDALARYQAMMADAAPPGQAVLHREKAISYYKQSIPIYESLGDLDYLKSAHLYLSEQLELTGNSVAALDEYRKYTEIKDSLFSTGMQENITKLETEREVVVKDRELQIRRLNARNERQVLGGGILILLLLAGFAGWGYWRQRRNNGLLSKEKRRSEALLLNILPASVAEELKQTGHASAQYYDEVTVLFTDFVNFTEAAERLSPQELVSELHSCFRYFDTITSRHGIEKIKTIGDAYLAVAGLPNGLEDHAGKAVQAAIEINRFVQLRRKEAGSLGFDIRIGIHTGQVVAGIVGVKKYAYDIWGDAVNIAARMEQTSDIGRINISQSTYDKVKDRFRLSYRGEINAKNKGLMKMYFVEED